MIYYRWLINDNEVLIKRNQALDVNLKLRDVHFKMRIVNYYLRVVNYKYFILINGGESMGRGIIDMVRTKERLICRDISVWNFQEDMVSIGFILSSVEAGIENKYQGWEIV